MTWKSTATASVAMVVATWLASYAPVGGPRVDNVSPPATGHADAAAEIEREADRLHDRLKQAAAYKQPQRNLFQFSERPSAQPLLPPPPPVTMPEPPASPPPQPAIQITLSGIAEDMNGDQVIRTAIISTPENVHIVKIGDAVGDMYKVSKIDADAVELSRVDDGSTLRLVLNR